MGYCSRAQISLGSVKLCTLRILVFFALLFSFSTNLWAKPVGVEKARKAVRGWLKIGPNPLGTALGHQAGKVETFTDEDGEPIYHVVYLQPSGFVIVPADDLVEPIICFAARGIYDPSDNNPLGALVSGDVPRRVAAVRTLQSTISTAAQQDLTSQQRAFQEVILNAQTKWSDLQAYDDMMGTLGLSGVSDLRVGPLLRSTWGQTTIGGFEGNPACYNYYTPPGPDGDPYNYPCGCTATATAQLMRYHEYATGGYNWSNMPLQPDMSTILTERQTIGAFCFDVAEAIDTVYGPSSSGGSSASLSDASEELRVTFGYNNSIHIYQASGIMSFINDMVNPNLDAAHPVLLGIDGDFGGHSVVCDGYGYNSLILYHHLSLGWDGREDAWYNLPNVDSSPYDFDTVHSCVYNVFTSESGEIISGRVTDLADNPIEDVTITAESDSHGTYQTTTDANGIYALLAVASNENYTVSAGKSGHAFIDQNVSTGLSADGSSTPGNVWGVDFVSQSATPPTAYDDTVEALSGSTEPISLYATDEGYPDPPGQLTYIIASLPTHGRLTDPGVGRITSVPYTLVSNGNTVDYWPCTYYTGQDFFNFKANDGGTGPLGGDSQVATITIDVNNIINTTFEPTTNTYGYDPLDSSYVDSRTELIYLQSEIGGAKLIKKLALNIHIIPGQILNNFTIRMQHTTLNQFSSSLPEIINSGWTTVYQNNENISTGGWRYFSFQTPFDYNGADNLLIDFSFNNSSSSTKGACFISNTGATRSLTLKSPTGSHGDPLDWTIYTIGSYWPSGYVPNLKLVSIISADPIVGDFEPDCDVDIEDLAELCQHFALIGHATLLTLILFRTKKHHKQPKRNIHLDCVLQQNQV